MATQYKFPTQKHSTAAEVVKASFTARPKVDTVLVVNSCARSVATADSDLDFAILAKPHITLDERVHLKNDWSHFADKYSAISDYKNSGPFSHLHLKIIEGKYIPQIWETGVETDNLEIRIGNQIRYSAPMGKVGVHFHQLQLEWLPYYDEELRLQRLKMAKKACEYDLSHIPILVARDLHFHALDTLCKAFREYLQALFIANQTYPIAYNKWIKEQVVKWLNRPDLYAKLAPILSIKNIESNEINDKVVLLQTLLLKL